MYNIIVSYGYIFTKIDIISENNFAFAIKEFNENIDKQFLEPGNEWMNWDNQGAYNSKTWDDNDKSTWKWQLDHIIPQSDLPYTSMQGQLPPLKSGGLLLA